MYCIQNIKAARCARVCSKWYQLSKQLNTWEPANVDLLIVRCWISSVHMCAALFWRFQIMLLTHDVTAHSWWISYWYCQISGCASTSYTELCLYMTGHAQVQSVSERGPFQLQQSFNVHVIKETLRTHVRNWPITVQCLPSHAFPSLDCPTSVGACKVLPSVLSSELVCVWIQRTWSCQINGCNFDMATHSAVLNFKSTTHFTLCFVMSGNKKRIGLLLSKALNNWPCINESLKPFHSYQLPLNFAILTFCQPNPCATFR